MLTPELRDEIEALYADYAEALDDNICRCGSHIRILRAVERAAARLREAGTR